MKGNAWIHFTRHISKMSLAGGKGRVAYAFGNCVLMALSVVFALGVKWCWVGMVTADNIPFIAGLLGLIVCIPLTVHTHFQGFVAQIILIGIAGFGIADPEERAGNIIAFIIALLTTAAVITLCVFFFKSL